MEDSNNTARWLLGCIIYLILGCLVMSRLRGRTREVCFALLNAPAFLILCFPDRFLALSFLVSVLVSYTALNLFAEKPGWTPWLAFLTPIAILIFVRYLFIPLYTAHQSFEYIGKYGMPQLVGISYFAFRNSYMVLQIRNGVVKKPDFWAYMGFSFFIPTMFVGPINPYANYSRGFEDTPAQIPKARAGMRILVGLVKYEFLGSITNRLTYAGLLQDDHYHPWIDLPIAAVFYYLFLYCNFSGFCDMAIGGAGLMGIPVAENFQQPFSSRNMREFWNRWHITLSEWMRDVVFSPLSKYLARRLGPDHANHALVLTITVVFLLIGIWHGVGINYAVFGLLQAVGVIICHYYTIYLKKRLGRDGFKAYNANPWIRAVATVVTFRAFQ